MINLIHKAGGKTNLVAVGAVALRSAGGKLSLRKLAGQGRLQGRRRVGSAGDTHRLVNIAAARERIADCAAKARSSTTERLDLGRVVVRLVFEEHKPLLGLGLSVARHRNRYNNGAGVDLVGHLHVRKLAFRAKLLHREKGNVHEADEFVVAALIENLALRLVCVKCSLDRLAVITLVNLHIRKLGLERSVAAVIRPVRIQHANLRHGRVALLLAAEVLLDEQKVAERHGEVQGIVQILEGFFVHVAKSVKNLNIFRHRKLGNQRLRFRLVGLSGVHGVYAVSADSGELLVGHLAREHVRRGAPDDWLLRVVKKLHALLRGVGSLVELSRQILYGKYAIPLFYREFLLINVVDWRLGKNGSEGLFIGFLTDVLHIVTHENTHVRKRFQAEILANLACKLLRAYRERRLLLHINTSDQTHIPPPSRAVFGPFFLLSIIPPAQS